MRSGFYILFFFAFISVKAQLLDSLTLDTLTPYTSLVEAMKEPDKVIKLQLRKQRLKTFPKEIFMFKNLQYLDLGKNNIKLIPDSIGVLTNLQYLDVSRNIIEQISGNIGKLTNLFYLNLNNNEFSSLPPQMGNLTKLRTLDLWSNNLDDFPEALKGMKSLQVLDLRVILIPDDKQKYISSLFPQTTIYFSPSCNCKW
ncbi:MAG TPA: leucine-rich repeat domain-containing protein [Bacteroidia bacterium]